VKISMGMNLVAGPWGGGNQFGHGLRDYLMEQGCSVSFDLNQKDLDIILLTEPRRELRISAYGREHVQNYVKYINNKVVVVHRINECDERKETENVNEQLVLASRQADHTVFISTWLKDLFVPKGISHESSSVILNGADRKTFYPDPGKSFDTNRKLGLVTHHWGNQWNKGFDIYQKLDALLDTPEWKDKLSFTYIGRLPENFRFSFAKYLEPLSGVELAEQLRRQDIYISASRNEPAGMHHIEGAMSGLPLLYIESGALPEYCDGFGISFAPENFEQKLQEIISSYSYWLNCMPHYSHNTEQMCNEYYVLFKELISNREKVLLRREGRTHDERFNYGNPRIRKYLHRLRNRARHYKNVVFR